MHRDGDRQISGPSYYPAPAKLLPRQDTLWHWYIVNYSSDSTCHCINFVYVSEHPVISQRYASPHECWYIHLLAAIAQSAGRLSGSRPSHVNIVMCWTATHWYNTDMTAGWGCSDNSFIGVIMKFQNQNDISILLIGIEYLFYQIVVNSYYWNIIFISLI